MQSPDSIQAFCAKQEAFFVFKIMLKKGRRNARESLVSESARACGSRGKLFLLYMLLFFN
jgi:hypothetical protein